jgi:S1-C subfamily serine protease
VPPPSSTNVTPQKGAIIASVKPAIAYISSRAGKGSGFVVAPNVVVTNEHVVRDSFRVYLHLSSGGTTTGYVSGRNKESDLAIITIPTTSISPLLFGDSGEASLKQGDALYAFGFPFGLSGDPSFNEGSLSRRLDFEGKNYLEISNPIHPGNSGGPLVNESGKVVGVDIAIYGNQSASGNLVGETIKFAIPGNAAKSVVDALIGKMRPLSVEKKRQIDQYEDFMDDFDTTIIAIGAEMIEASDAVTRNSTTDLKQSSTDLDQLLGKLRNIKDRIPAFPFVNKFQNAVADITQLTQSSKELADGYIDYIAHGGDQNPDLNSVRYIQNVVETIKTSSNQYYDDRDALNASALEFLSY